MVHGGIGQHLLKLLSIIIAPGHRPISIDMDNRVAMLLRIFLCSGDLSLDRLLGLPVGRISCVNNGDFVNWIQTVTPSLFNENILKFAFNGCKTKLL